MENSTNFILSVFESYIARITFKSFTDFFHLNVDNHLKEYMDNEVFLISRSCSKIDAVKSNIDLLKKTRSIFHRNFIHHVFDERTHPCPALCCIGKLSLHFCSISSLISIELDLCLGTDDGPYAKL